MTRDRDGRTPVSGSGSGSGAQITIQDLQGGMTEIGQNQSQVEGIDGEAGKVGGPFMDLIWPGWPPRLPTPGKSIYPDVPGSLSLMLISHDGPSVSVAGRRLRKLEG